MSGRNGRSRKGASSASPVSSNVSELSILECEAVLHGPLDFISSVQACTSSSTSSGTTVALFHDDW